MSDAAKDIGCQENHVNTKKVQGANSQFTTFYVSGQLYGIDVMQVQEVTKSLPMTNVPLSATYMHGLINLRGQIANAIDLRELFGLPSLDDAEKMNVICECNGILLSLLVDKIGDVMEVDDSDFEGTPDTIQDSVKRFMKGVYKMDTDLLGVIDIDAITSFLTDSKKLKD